jgi:RNA polymerase sigma-70 factor (ECF subfamily)
MGPTCHNIRSANLDGPSSLAGAGFPRSPVVELNRAVAVAMRDGPEAGLVLIDKILKRGDLVDYHLAHAARAELCPRFGKMSDAKNSYQRALSLARQEPERRFLTRRPSEI